MTEPNGGSTEYQNIIGNLDNIGNLLEEELLNKKIESSEVSNPLDGMLNLLLPITTGTAAVLAPITIDMTLKGTSYQAVSFSQGGQLVPAVQQAVSAIQAMKSATPNFIQGGLRSIINFVTKIPIVVWRVLGVVVAAGLAVWQVMGAAAKIGDEVNALYERAAALEVELGTVKGELQKLKTQTQKNGESIEGLTQQTNIQNQNINNLTQGLTQTNQNVQALQKGLVNVEATTNKKINTLNKRVTSVENQVEGLEQLIKTNHLETRGAFHRITDLVTGEFADVKRWQANNGAEAVATLAAQATTLEIEKPGGTLQQTKALAEAAKASADDAGNIGRNNGQKIQDAANDAKEKFKKLGMSFDIGIIIDVITMITSLHNAAMLSKDIVGTCVQVLETGVNAAFNLFGYKGATDEAFDLSKILSETFENLAKTVLGAENWVIFKAQFAAASKITSGLNGILWATREIAESTNSLAQSAAENTGKLGNRLIASGVLDDIGTYFPENYSMRSRLGRKMAEATGFLEGVLNTAQGFEQFTSEVLSITENVKEIQENVKEVAKGIEELEPKRTPTNTKVLAEIILENNDGKSPVLELSDLAPAPKES